MAGNRIQQRFEHNRHVGQKGLLPYLTAGFPDRRTATELVRRTATCGVTAIEIGFPFSDSIADGPVIQSSFHHALEQGHRVEHAFEMVRELRGETECGLVAMVTFTLVERMGLEPFVDRCAAAGFDGLILPDLPVEESALARQVIEHAGMCHIGLVAPTTTDDRRQRIAEASSGFVYQIAAAGTTGERAVLSAELPEQVRRLKEISGLPVCVGFGVSGPEQVREVCHVADGAIVGSAIVRRIENAMTAGAQGDQIVDEVEGFVGELLTGTRGER